MSIQTVSDLFPSKWLKSDDLGGRVVPVKIQAVDIEDIRQADGSKQAKAILTFERASKRLILNKTQATALAEIIGSERLADWPGHRVELAPATASNNRPTIQIRRAATSEPARQPG